MRESWPLRKKRGQAVNLGNFFADCPSIIIEEKGQSLNTEKPILSIGDQGAVKTMETGQRKIDRRELLTGGGRDKSGNKRELGGKGL